LVKIEKVFISIDMEGISGIVDGSQCGGQTGEYTYGRKLMVGDLNAAIEGALEVGAQEIVVSDSHGGMKNVQPEEVHEAAMLIRGTPKPDVMMTGIGSEYDAAMYIGYHAMKGTKNGILAHTISGGTVDSIWINGRETGEFGLNAALAGHYDVPSVLMTGDYAVSEEAKAFVPSISTAVVKWGVGRKAGKCLHPKKARALIKLKTMEALENVGNIAPFTVEGPVNFILKYGHSGGGDMASRLPFLERVDGRTVKATFDSYPEALNGLMSAITTGGAGMRR
jgi:D-amino peptidase